MKKLNEFAMNLPMMSVPTITSPAPYDVTADISIPPDVDSTSTDHINVYVDGTPSVNQAGSQVTMDLVLNVSVTNPSTGSYSTYKIIKRLAFDKCKLALQAETGQPFQVVEGEGEPEDPVLVEQEMQAFYYAREVRRRAGLDESAGAKRAKVLFTFKDTSDAQKRADPEGKVNARGSATVTIDAVKDKAHARHVFNVKHADRYEDPKITRVTMEEETK